MKNKKDSLGDRMKANYEVRTRTYLPRRTNAIIRLDGKAFHTFTKGLDRPIDEGFTEDMNETAKYVCENIQGAKFGYVQSDEISVLITDYDDLQTDAWFDYNIQKMCSIAASLATAKFNQLRTIRAINNQESGTDMSKVTRALRLAQFDARVFSIPELEEVVNYFVWRQQDATRNSISMAAQSMYSHKELHGKSSADMQDMMMERGTNWNDYPIGFRRGRAIVKFIWRTKSPLWVQRDEMHAKKIEAIKQQDFEKAAAFRGKEKEIQDLMKTSQEEQEMVRKRWEILDPPIFTQDRDYVKFTMLHEVHPDHFQLIETR